MARLQENSTRFTAIILSIIFAKKDRFNRFTDLKSVGSLKITTSKNCHIF